MLAKTEPQPDVKTAVDGNPNGRDGHAQLLEQAARCRRLARATTDPRAAEILAAMASDYAATAADLNDR